MMFADNGEKGIEILRRQPPDIVLPDILMPGRDGWSVLSEIKSDDSLKNLPVIVIICWKTIRGRKARCECAYDQAYRSSQRLTTFDICWVPILRYAALIIDDDAQARDLLIRLLSSNGFELSTAENATGLRPVE